MEKNKIALLVVLCVALALAVMIAVGIILDNKGFDVNETDETSFSEAVNVPKLVINSSVEENEWITVNTTYGDFRYSKAMSDILYVESINNEKSSQLAVGVVIGGSKVLAYTIHFNENVGSYCGLLNLDENYKAIPVYVTFEQVDSSIQTESQNAFYAVQETVNEILTSMDENGNFIPAE